MIYLWVDESDKHGSFYSNFYGGILIHSDHYNHVVDVLTQTIRDLHIDEEIKWQKVNEYWLERYTSLVDVIFSLMAQRYIKMRIFFRHNQYVALGLTQSQKREEYQRLYYQFIKHAFGWEYANPDKTPEYIKIMLDDMPLGGDENEDFKQVLFGLNKDPKFRTANLHIRPDEIVEVYSKKHLPLQIMDLILGAMCFRLWHKTTDKQYI